MPEVAARAHLRWMIPVLEEARERAGIGGLVGARGDRRHRGPGPRRLAARGHHDGPDAGLGDTACRSCRSTTSRATSTPPGCSTPTSPSGPRPSSRSWRSSSAAATRSSSRWRDHLRYRLLGQTVDDAAGRGVRQGRAAARAAVSRRPGHHGRRERRDAARSPLPARLAGRHVRLLVQRPQDRRPARGRRGARARHRREAADAREPDGASLPAADGRRAGLGLPGLGGRRARDEDAAGGAATWARATSSSAAASPPTACCASGSPRVPASWASRSSCRGPGCAPTTRR